jgi:ribosomal protein L11 methyltransferase
MMTRIQRGALAMVLVVCLQDSSLLTTHAWSQVQPSAARSTSFRSGMPASSRLFTSSVQVYEETSLEAATLRSVTFSHLAKHQEPDLLADFLLELGAYSSAVTDADAGTDREVPLFGEPGADPWNESLQWGAPVWNFCNVTAHFAASTDLQWVVEMVQESFPEQFPTLAEDYTVAVVPDKDWVIHVQSSWKPIVVGHKFVLRFPWHSADDVQQALEKDGVGLRGDQETVQLLLQGGIAFGTGEHPTTQLCLSWLDRTITDSLLPQQGNFEAPLRLLDYGAGSGVLGMAACRLAPVGRLRAVGLDIDVDACRIANANAVENEVDMLNYLPPLVEKADDASKSLFLKAHAHARSELSDRKETGDDLILPEAELALPYDLCVANILAGPLMTLATTIATMVKEGGYIGMSGILPPQGQGVVKAYTEAGFVDMKVEKEVCGWVLVTGRKGTSA